MGIFYLSSQVWGMFLDLLGLKSWACPVTVVFRGRLAKGVGQHPVLGAGLVEATWHSLSWHTTLLGRAEG